MKAEQHQLTNGFLLDLQLVDQGGREVVASTRIQVPDSHRGDDVALNEAVDEAATIVAQRGMPSQ